MFEAIPPITLAALAILFGFVGLVWSADRFVAGAASIAEAFGVAPMIIGLTIVSFGTSAPEVMVSLIAAMTDAGELAVGNAIGSNIANIGLVLGVTTLVSRIQVQSHLLTQETPILLAIYAICGVFLFNAILSPFEGWILLGLLIPSIWYLTTRKKREPEATELEEDVTHYSPLIAVLWFIVGLVLLIISSKVLVWGAETTAVYFNISPLIIGLSVIAIGTSLPELAASVMSALRGHHDIAVGNIIGSNIFNLLAVMSIPGIFAMSPMEPSVFSRDFVAMVAVTLALVIFIAIRVGRKRAGYIGRITGAVLLSAYAFYIYLLGQSQF